jgi:putative SOS response-associated peptidase YedK
VETAPESRLYRSAFSRRRCLIIADGFYEWQPGETPKAGKTPFWITRLDGAPFAFAGLYSVWRPKEQPDAPPVLSCSILTTAANAIVEPIHARMPVILQPEQEAAWIDPAVQDPAQVRELLKPDAASLVTRAVSKLVNSVRNDRPELLAESLKVGA